MGKGRRKAPLGILFWIGVLLLISVLYMVNHERIREVLDNTGFVEVVFEDQAPEGVSRRSRDGSGEQPSPETAPLPTEDGQDPDQDPEMVNIPEVEPEEAPETDIREDSDNSESNDGDDEVVDAVPEPEQPPETPTRSIETTLYFIRVTDDGMILPEAVKRIVPDSNSPLTETIQALFDGPSSEDLNRGLLSLLPPDAALLSARVENGVAYLNFNEQFRFNAMGVEGLVAQLQQVVYTTTQFPSVNKVQILIEGETQEYLGPEGVFIGRPLDRQSFRS